MLPRTALRRVLLPEPTLPTTATNDFLGIARLSTTKVAEFPSFASHAKRPSRISITFGS